MTRFYEVNPANTSEISAVDANGRRYEIDPGDVSTQTGVWQYIYTGGQPSRIQAADPNNNLYATNEDNSTCPPYHTRSKTLAFVGTVGAAAARVQETAVCTPISLDDLLATKLGELDQYASFVSVQSVLSTSNNNFWVSLAPRPRQFIAAVDNFYYGDRLKDRVIGTDSSVGYSAPPDPDPTTWWPQDVYVMLIRDSNGNRLLSLVGETDYGQVLKDVGNYDLATMLAEAACANDIDAQYQASDFNALAAIDVQSAAYGWPVYYTGPQSVGVRVL